MLDWTGTPVVRDASPPRERIADTAGVREPWSSRVIREVTPELAARLLTPGAELSEVMAFCKRIQRDAHIFAVTRTLKLSIAGLDWQVLPFDDSPEAEKQRLFIEQVLLSIPRLSQLFVHLLDGEIKPLSGVEMIYDAKTWLPTGWTRIDGVRWTRHPHTGALLLRTIRAPQGEPITPNGFIIHRAQEEPLWEKLAWPFLFIRFANSEWVRFGELYGKPFRLAFYEDPNDKAVILEAVRELGVNAAGVFPAGTEVRLEEAQRSGTVNLYQSLKRECEEAASKVVLGHALNADARTGSGLQAGNAAKDVSDENRKSVAIGLADTLREYLIRPLIGWHFGWQYADRLPSIKFAYEPPEDLKYVAETLKIANELLSPAGETIDPEFIKEKFGIPKTVKRASAPQQPEKVKDESGARKNDNDTDNPPDERETESARLVAHEAAEAPVIRSLDDAQALAVRIAAKAGAERAQLAQARANAADTIDAFVDELFATYDDTPEIKTAAVLRDALTFAHELGRAEAA